MFETNQASCELVFFWDGENVARSMLYPDFEASLDGVVGIAAYAGELKRAAYVQLDAGLNIRSCALFGIRFEADGFPERSWNIPLRHIVEIAGRGPDLGAGPIQLACRSQCPISWLAGQLWDPVMKPEHNTFEAIRREALQAAARFGYRPPKAAPVLLTEVDIPVLTESAPEPSPSWGAEREELLKRLQEQQLHINTLENDKNDTVNQLGFVHQQQVDILEAQNQKLLGQFRAMKAQNDSQREQVDALRQQMDSLGRLEANLTEERRLHEEQLQAALRSQSGADAERLAALLAQKDQEFSARESRLKEELRLSLEQRMEEEAGRHQLQLSSVVGELRAREELLQAQAAELGQLKAAQASIQQATVDSLLRQFAEIGINFIAFHPGVGNIAIPVNELALYVQSPVAYAAAKALVSQEHYQTWLQHYESPRCMAKIGEGKCCDARLIRVDSPTRFVPGQSDHCARHQSSDSAIANVLRFH